MQIVSSGDGLHEMSNSVLEKIFMKFQNPLPGNNIISLSSTEVAQNGSKEKNYFKLW